MATYEELLASVSPEMQARLKAQVEEESRKITLNMLRDKLNMSQKELAKNMGVSQPAIVRMEQPDNDPRLSTLKRYINGLGGKLSLDVTLPDGTRIGFDL
ncbi:Predicted transcriptional regulator with C-terminal CBS domains [Pasteurella testudinis DSM 23072]|uniref:Predicted transcriptional regulator with C-terminal CBS domains n=1 Tax=Pasteurella testudinis DSM 23072 TaxID=1122938 RepID=A0A1W1VA59_9PAST|nr:helix-turn-helix domain-containing protein [Pasteurella testudinis]SMB90205.1 Predicted transcriptional regulator with C-terminal CBS domains [Pasteurella testudinis DSM 23072]SUB51355.1 Antitoxin HigA [Pasteurella testudinis]